MVYVVNLRTDGIEVIHGGLLSGRIVCNSVRLCVTNYLEGSWDYGIYGPEQDAYDHSEVRRPRGAIPGSPPAARSPDAADPRRAPKPVETIILLFSVSLKKIGRAHV